MPKPPPRFSSGSGATRASSACAASRRSADSANPAESKICEPMWQCRPRRSSEACERMRVPSSTARSRETPNFWSSWAVARNSCVEACTPLFTRSRTRCTRPARAAASATRSISISLSMMIAPTPAATARSISATDLLLPWNPMPRGFGARGERDGELAAGAHVDAEAGLGDPAHDRARRGTPCPRSRPSRSCRRMPRPPRTRRGCAPRGPARRTRRPRRAACRIARRARWRRRRPRPGGRRRRGARARARPAGPGHWRRRARGAIRVLLRWLPRGNLNGTRHRRDRSRRANPDWFLKPAACRPCGAGYGESTEARQSGPNR